MGKTNHLLSPLHPWIAQKIGIPSKNLDRQAIEAYQLSMINKTISYARQHSSFYRKFLSQQPNHIEKLADLSTFPFTTADDLSKCNAQMLCLSQEKINRICPLDSSGTSGQPQQIYFSAADTEHTLDFFANGMSTFTKPGEKVLILLPGEHPGSISDLLSISLKRLNAEGIVHGPVLDPFATLSTICKSHVAGLVGNPYQVLLLVRLWEANREAFPLNLKFVLLTDDYVPRSIVNFLQDTWGCAIHQHYGTTEMGMSGGISCSAQQGYHLCEADMVFEIINPDTGLHVADGQDGEIVFTTLTREGMPLIRYRTGEISSFSPARCLCGAELRTMGWVKGRIDGRIKIGPYELTVAQMDDVLFGIEGLLGYSAFIELKKGETILNIDAYFLDPSEETKHNIYSLLNTVKSIAFGCITGSLSMKANITKGLPPFIGDMTKRKIEDRR